MGQPNEQQDEPLAELAPVGMEEVAGTVAMPPEDLTACPGGHDDAADQAVVVQPGGGGS
ncbi:hypothetical protein [Actinoplanes sp. NBRC 101535]|uniref:hypothetical protein n=1 Tax=Actinoplanes sp. NBRC 101535 TaxID=3032196 RepID=UPI0024A5B81F|nr:hypothetical protein [Actinoplanes sp. NBRC 101535]GLY08280.1 hypothetical protein Acsp01_86590 [Actinoplanes sp. NBRC 101535]